MRFIGSAIHQHARDTARVIYLAVPTFGTVSYEWHSHMMQLQNPMNRSVFHGAAIGLEVGDARNILVDQALRYTHPQGLTASHVFFVDDDTLIPPDALMRLLARKLPIVSGLYYSKTDVPQPLMIAGEFGGVVESWEPGSLVPCRVHGMGCTLIEIGVFHAMIEAGVVQAGTYQGREIARFFSTTRDELTRDKDGIPTLYQETEDAYFLKRATQVGYQPTVDTSVFCWHWDHTRKEAAPYAAWREFRTTGRYTLPGQAVAA